MRVVELPDDRSLGRLVVLRGPEAEADARGRVELPEGGKLALFVTQPADLEPLKDLEPGTIEILSFRFAEAGDSEFEQAAAVPGLTEIRAPGTQVSDEGIAAIGTSFRLEKLLLSGTEVTDSSAIWFNKLQALKVLTVDDTKVTDRFVLDLDLPNLCSLSVLNTEVGEKGIAGIQTTHQAFHVWLGNPDDLEEGNDPIGEKLRALRPDLVINGVRRKP